MHCFCFPCSFCTCMVLIHQFQESTRYITNMYLLSVFKRLPSFSICPDYMHHHLTFSFHQKSQVMTNNDFSQPSSAETVYISTSSLLFYYFITSFTEYHNATDACASDKKFKHNSV
eukprot:TRINITY_DN7871_c0_g2_i1.p1 TRINITY_DN7871_c0_g2~~TRINITY_DN7871_c0_g2_i1.p1  ORF type:complete len:116 (+),score=4.73 TRINITY_DN7871_c0_g2_i1:63-410(+)